MADVHLSTESLSAVCVCVCVCVCVYSNSCNDVPRVAQRYGLFPLHAALLFIYLLFPVYDFSFI